VGWAAYAESQLAAHLNTIREVMSPLDRLTPLVSKREAEPPA
jgi:hypothetical protein